MTTASKADVFTDDHFNLVKIQRASETLQNHYIAILACHNVRESVFRDDDKLHMNSSDLDPHIVTATYAGTTIRFQLLLGMDSNQQAIGRVVCSLQYDFQGKKAYEFLDEFTYTTDGRTSFPTSISGKPYYIGQAADLIVSHFLRKALERNLTISFSK